MDTFVDLPTAALTIDRSGTGTGGVTATGLTCAGGAGTQAVPCGASYTQGASVTLTAVPDSGSTFGGWSGVCTGTSTCTVTMSAARFVSATFTKTPTTVSLTYYHTDMIGSVRAITDETGATVIRHDYGPFGEDTQPMTGDPIRFGGKELDPETGLQNFEARYYRQTWGRFAAVDPVGGSLGDTQSWNRYAYARNNPLRLVDPSGRNYQVLYDYGNASDYTDEQFKDLVTFYLYPNTMVGDYFHGTFNAPGWGVIALYNYYDETGGAYERGRGAFAGSGSGGTGGRSGSSNSASTTGSGTVAPPATTPTSATVSDSSEGFDLDDAIGIPAVKVTVAVTDTVPRKMCDAFCQVIKDAGDKAAPIVPLVGVVVDLLPPSWNPWVIAAECYFEQCGPLGVAFAAFPFLPDQAALVALAKEGKAIGGVSSQNASTLLEWAEEYGLAFRGPEVHPGRNFNIPHIHVGPVDHIPVK